MKALLTFAVLISLASTAFATKVGDTLPAFKIENQFGEPAELTADTSVIIFSSDMKAAKMLTAYLNDNAAKHDLSKTLIISDISRMPTSVSKMFAIPKMKKYNFKLALDKSGETTKDWPRQEASLTVMKLTQLKIDSVNQVTTPEGVASIFADKP